MRKILAGMILCLGLALFTNSARAESNPLLDVFEALRGGETGTLVKDINEALSLQNKSNDNVYRHSTGYVERKIIKAVDDKYKVITWTWWNAAFDGAKVKAPTATLEVIVENKNDILNQRIVDAKYHYIFLDLEKTKSLYDRHLNK